MNEETIFIEALEIRDPIERAAFLDRAAPERGLPRSARAATGSARRGQRVSRPFPVGIDENGEPG